jgi:hypothetical protein
VLKNFIYLDVNTYNLIFQSVSKNEGNGILRGRQTEGSGLTALHQSNLVHNEGIKTRGYSTIPDSWGRTLWVRMKDNFAYLEIKIC